MAAPKTRRFGLGFLAPPYSDRALNDGGGPAAFPGRRKGRNSRCSNVYLSLLGGRLLNLRCARYAIRRGASCPGVSGSKLMRSRV